LLAAPPRPPATLSPYTTLFRSPPDALPHHTRLNDRSSGRGGLPRNHPAVRFQLRPARVGDLQRSAALDRPELGAVLAARHLLRQIGRATSELQSRENLVCRLLL